MPDEVTVLLLAAAGSAVVALAGVALLRALRGRSLRASAMAVPLVAVAAILAGALLTARTMFTSEHDLWTLLLLSVPAALVAGGTGAFLGRRVARDVAAVPDLAAAPDAPLTAVPTELSALVGQLRAGRQEVDEVREREREAEARRRELFSWVSHDLRTPLSGLRAMAEALEDGVVDDPPTVLKYHRRMRLEVERQTRMVDDLLELSLIQTGGRRVERSRLALADVMADAVAAAEALAAGKGIRLMARTEGPGTPVLGEPRALARVVANLLGNALRHTPSGGTVSVVTGEAGGQAWLAVSDECGGIPERDLPRLFEVGFRGDLARTPAPDSRHTAGAGLGLAIVGGLVEQHGGSVAVVNAGRGCRVRVELPVATELAEPVEPSAPRAPVAAVSVRPHAAQRALDAR